jgi:methyl-accepting chemotaxis protein
MDNISRRRNYFIDKNFQTKFILKFCSLVAVGGLFTIGIVYLLAMRSTTVSFVNSRAVVRSTADFILPLLFQTVLIVTVMVSLATIIVTLLVSHKIAGPLYRFKKALKMLEEGDFSSNFKIRHYDQLQDVAEVFNQMISKIREELKSLRDNFQYLQEKLGNISEHEVVEQKRSILNELKKISLDLSKIIRFFKT